MRLTGRHLGLLLMAAGIDRDPLVPLPRYVSPIFDPPAPSPAVQEIDRARRAEQRRHKRARRKRKHARGF